MANLRYQNGKLGVLAGDPDPSVPGASQAAPLENLSSEAQDQLQQAQAEQAKVAEKIATEDQKVVKEASEQRTKAAIAQNKAQGEALKAEAEAAKAGVQQEVTDTINASPVIAAGRKVLNGEETPSPATVAAPTEAPAKEAAPAEGTKDPRQEQMEALKEESRLKEDQIIQEAENQMQIQKEQVQSMEALKAESDELRRDPRAKRAEMMEKFDAIISASAPDSSPSIANLVGIAMGGLLAPNMGGRNIGLEAFNTMIDREINTEMANRKMQASAINDKLDVINDEAAVVEQDIEERSRLRAGKLKALENTLQAQANKEFLPGIQRQQANQQIAEVKRLRIEEHEKVVDRQINRELRAADMARKLEMDKARMRKMRMGGRGKGGGKGRRGIPDPNVNIKNGVFDARKIEDGKGGFKPGAVLRGEFLDKNGNKIDTIRLDASPLTKEFQKKVIVTKAMGSNLQKLVNLTKQSGTFDVRTGVISSELAKRMGVRFHEAVMQIKDSDEMGALAGPDLNLILAKLGGDPSSMFQGMQKDQILAAFQEVVDVTNEKMNITVETMTGASIQYNGVSLKIGDNKKASIAARIAEADAEESVASKINILDKTSNDLQKGERLTKQESFDLDKSISERLQSKGISSGEKKQLQNLQKKNNKIKTNIREFEDNQRTARTLVEGGTVAPDEKLPDYLKTEGARTFGDLVDMEMPKFNMKDSMQKRLEKKKAADANRLKKLKTGSGIR